MKRFPVVEYVRPVIMITLTVEMTDWAARVKMRVEMRLEMRWRSKREILIDFSSDGCMIVKPLGFGRLQLRPKVVGK